MKLDVGAVADKIRKAALRDILPRYQQLSGADVHSKADATDLATAASEAAERFLKRELAMMLPNALFIGEKAASKDPRLLDLLRDAEIAVVVDPVDGTANFVAGMPLFGVMASVVRYGKSVAGLIYDPMGGDLVIAEQGGGAFLVREDGSERRLVVSDAVPLSHMVGYVSTDFLPAGVKADILARLAKPRMFSSHRCSAHMYRAFSSGHGHFVMLDRLTPWDNLAGTLISTEAGGYAACFDGSPYDPSKRSGALLTATDPDSWHILMREVFAHEAWRPRLDKESPTAKARPWYGCYGH